MSLSRAKNIFMPANINSIVILYFLPQRGHPRRVHEIFAVASILFLVLLFSLPVVFVASSILMVVVLSLFLFLFSSCVPRLNGLILKNSVIH